MLPSPVPSMMIPDAAHTGPDASTSGLMDTLREGVLVLDGLLRIGDLNDAALRYLHLFHESKDPFIGQNLFDVVPALRGTHFETELRIAVKGRKPVEFEFDDFPSHPGCLGIR